MKYICHKKIVFNIFINFLLILLRVKKNYNLMINLHL